MMDALQHISNYLNEDARTDLKVLSVDYVLKTTGTEAGRELLLKVPQIPRLLTLLLHDQSTRIKKECAKTLINISADEAGARALLIISETSKADYGETGSDNLIYLCFENIMYERSDISDACCMILANITRIKYNVDRVVTLLDKGDFPWSDLLDTFVDIKFNYRGNTLDYLGPIYSNLSQSKKMRSYLFEEEEEAFQRLLPFVKYDKSDVRRKGVVGTIRNCSLDVENHAWLMSRDIDCLPYLLYPLAGPEEYSDEENSKLPTDLQYLPDTKEREKDPEIRKMLLETLNQLCATKKGRQYLRDNNAYLILRELHKKEKDKEVLLACENVVDIIIKTEEEIGTDNLKDVEVPEEYKKKFDEMDKLYLAESNKIHGVEEEKKK